MKTVRLSPKYRQKVKTIHDILFARYGVCGCPLVHASPFQLAVAVMLSAQCRDDRVNEVTPELFRRFSTPAKMAAAPIETVAEIIHPCGLYQTKSKNLVAMAKMVEQFHHGVLPSTMEELTALPGIGRKSANVILGNAFGIPGFPVDTHVTRVANRLGLATTPDPVKIESRITAAIAPEYWTNFSHLLILHGRDTCHARQPHCPACLLCKLCDYGGQAKTF